MNTNMSNHGIPRRNFLKGVAASAAIFPALSPALLAQEKLRDYRGPNVVHMRACTMMVAPEEFGTVLLRGRKKLRKLLVCGA